MKQFHFGETVVCRAEVKNNSDEYYDPSTSMKITISDAQNGAEVDDIVMVKETTGKYYYYYQTATATMKGKYIVSYKATNGIVISIQKDTFELL